MAEEKSGTDSEQLSTALAALRSSDVAAQNEGVDAAIRIGGPAVPGLRALLEESLPVRAQAMYALAQIGDPGAAQAFVEGLRDSDERVRAYAAQGLVRIDHPEALTACLQTLNDSVDPLHLDITPSVQALGSMDLRAVPALLDLLLDSDEMTRLHAQRALELILGRRYGFVAGQGFPFPDAAAAMREEWRANGDYSFSADIDSRRASVAKWRGWLANAKERA